MGQKMRLFVRFDGRGKIISVGKVEFMHPGMDHPHGAVNEGEDVIEVDPSPEHMALDAHELAEQYSVDVKKRKLHKRRK
jgi:hypothetical protein